VGDTWVVGKKRIGVRGGGEKKERKKKKKKRKERGTGTEGEEERKKKKKMRKKGILGVVKKINILKNKIVMLK
jgi:hypothetical protein